MTNNEKKRALICGLAVFAVAIMAATAFACLADNGSSNDDIDQIADNGDRGVWIDGNRYKLKEDGAYVMEIKDKKGIYDLPDSIEYEGKIYPVVEITSHAFTYGRVWMVDTLTIGPSVKKIDREAFNDTHMRHFAIRDIEKSQLEYVCSWAFAYSDIESIELPKSLRTISSFAFYHCRELKECILHSDSLVLDRQAFDGCCKLTKINLENVTDIGTECFKCVYHLDECNLTSIRNINEFAFQEVKTVDHVIYGKDLQYIGKDQFKGLKFVDFDGNVISETHQNLRGHEFVVGEDHRMHQVA